MECEEWSGGARTAKIGIVLSLALLTLSLNAHAVPSDETGPSVTSVGIVSITDADDTTDYIRIVFDTKMDASTINSDTITVEETGAADTVITGTVTYTGTTATFRPDARFADLRRRGNEFTVTVSDQVRDIAGNTLQDDSTWTLSTPRTADNTRPTVHSVDILSIAGTTGAHDYIRIVFSEQMRASTINTDTITVTEAGNPDREITGTVTYTGLVASFRPDAGSEQLQRPGNEFTVTVSGATDMAGNAVANDSEWTLQTPMTPGDGTPEPSAGGSWWTNWYLLVLLALLALLFLFTQKEPERTERDSPFGDIHDVDDIQGIGPVYKERLNDMGIHDSEELWEANPSVVAARIDVPPATVYKWQRMAELMSINGIGPQYAELLERSGVASILELSKADPDRLLKTIKEKEDSLNVNIQGNAIERTIVERWIREAEEHEFGQA